MGPASRHRQPLSPSGRETTAPYQSPVALLTAGRASSAVATSQMPSDRAVLSRKPRMRS